MQDKKYAFRAQNNGFKPAPKPQQVLQGGRPFPNVGVTLSSYSNRVGHVPQPQIGTPPQRKRTFPLRKVSLMLAGLILIACIFIGGKFVYNAHKLFGGNILGVLSTTKLKGEDQGRVNILLAGNSADDVGHNGGDLTDSIMLISIDTKNKTAFTMSIPRDLYVEITDGQFEKINYAYVYGKENHFAKSGYPDGGMGKLEKIVEDNFGLDINYYALVNYNAFRDAVDAVGGIDVTIKSSDSRGLYDPSIDYSTNGPLVKLSNGKHSLNGQQALNLARARGDNYRSYGFAASDFERTKNQRMMLIALKEKATTAGVLANPARLSKLSDAIGKNVQTDMDISEVRRLYDLTKDINGASIGSLSLNSANGKNLLDSYRTISGQSALIPAAGLYDYSDIQNFLTQQTSSNPVVREGASLVLLNGTETGGLAGVWRTKLNDKKFYVDAVGDGTSTTVTQIIDVSNGGKPGTLAALKKLFPKATTITKNTYPQYNNDFIVVLGPDAVQKDLNSSSSTTGQ